MDQGEDDRRRRSSALLLTKLGFVAVTGHSAVAIYRSWDDPSSVAFVAAAYAALLLLFRSLQKLEHARRPEDNRGRLTAAVWALTTLLTAMFAARVSSLMPPLVGVAVWAMAAATVGGGFWALFR